MKKILCFMLAVMIVSVCFATMTVSAADPETVYEIDIPTFATAHGYERPYIFDEYDDVRWDYQEEWVANGNKCFPDGTVIEAPIEMGGGPQFPVSLFSEATNGSYSFTMPIDLRLYDDITITLNMIAYNNSSYYTDMYIQASPDKDLSTAEFTTCGNLEKLNSSQLSGNTVTRDIPNGTRWIRLSFDAKNAYWWSINNIKIEGTPIPPYASVVKSSDQENYPSVQGGVEADGSGTTRFIWEIDNEFNAEISDFGACIIPFALFEDSFENNKVPCMYNYPDSSTEETETFSVDLNKIPSGYFDCTIYAIPFINDTLNIESALQTKVNDFIAE